jgi:hypothetical protein
MSERRHETTADTPGPDPDTLCERLPDPRGPMVVFHGDALDTEWLRCRETLVCEVRR